MREYGKVYATFWSSDTTGGMSDDAKLLALYLMTCSHSTIAGVFRLPDGYVSEDLMWGSERVSEGFRELFDKGFANRCETTKWVWIRKHLEWNKPENPNQRKAAAKVASSVPDQCAWKRDFWRDAAEVLTLEPLPEANPCETVPQTLSEPFLNQKQKQEQEQKGSEANASGGKPPSEKSKTELWHAAVSLLSGQGMPEAQARSFVGKLAKDYPDGDIVLEAVRATVAEQPADARAYLKATCQRLSGERKRSGAKDWTENAL